MEDHDCDVYSQSTEDQHSGCLQVPHALLVIFSERDLKGGYLVVIWRRTITYG